MNKETFDLDWEYTEATGFAAAFAQWQPVNLPHDLSIHKARNQSYPTGSGGGYAWSGVVTYRKKFTVPAEWRGQSVQVEFEGVYMNAEVSINGQLVALHPYGYTSFLVDVTSHLKYGEENVLVVVVNNSAQPNSRWYSGTGIYRHVWLRTGGSTHIQPWGVFVTTPVADPLTSTIHVLTELANSTMDAVLRSTVLDADGTQVAQTETPVMGATVEQVLTIQDARLWSVDEPNLYTLVSDVLADGAPVDSERTSFGIRSIAVDAQNGFRLNGVPMKLKGGCVHHDNGLLGAASYDRSEERKIELMKASGYNSIRCAHNPPAPAMLDACDRLGMLVIDETFDCWRTGKNPNDYHLFFEDWWQRDTESMVRRDRNHPSIIMWSIGNEVAERTGVSDGYAWARKQAAFIRSLDATRWITSALPFLFEEMFTDPSFMQSLSDAQSMFDPKKLVPADLATDSWGNRTGEFNEALDVVGYNYLFARYEWDGKRFPERVMAGTETFPYLAYDFWKEAERLPYVIGDFVWTSIDYLGESGIGRVTVDDPTPFFAANPWPYHLANCGDIDICGFKRPQSYFRDLLWGVRSAPFIAVLDPQLFGKNLQFNQWGWEPVIDSWDFPEQEGRQTRVDVYAIDEEVELFVNGVSAGRKPAGAAEKNKTCFEVTYQPGTIEVVGYRDGKETGRTHLKTAGSPVALRAAVDHPEIHREFGDLAYVTVEVLDQDGCVVKSADPEVSLEVAGVGELIAVGTANPMSEELYAGNKRKAWQGRLMAVIRSTGQAGEIVLKASTDGLNATEVRFHAK
ncbi:MAG TPA: glycoside hydrolase family 2 TIM barrel-domain containing protein [Anaerolineales bacterium]|nr:glycoside hydrolase family 2 TIM barrel-domain containing protein [Anaerolineales bacterium]